MCINLCISTWVRAIRRSLKNNSVYILYDIMCVYILLHMFCHATLYRRFPIICTASCQSSGCKIANLAALAFSFERIDLNAASPTFLGKRFPNPMVYLKSEHEDKSSYD